MDRRTFVKGSVAVASAGALAGGAWGLWHGLVPPSRLPNGKVRFFGAHAIGGPAPYGTPYIPIRIEGGRFVVRTEIPVERALRVTWDPLSWHRYCGGASKPGLDPAFNGSNELRYHMPEDRLAIVRPWYTDKLGEVLRPDDFPAEDFGTRFVWRSDDPEDSRALYGIIVRTKGEFSSPTETAGRGAQTLNAAELDYVRREVFAGAFVAVNAACTHFCCTAGYKEAEKLAKPRNAWDHVFCTCHNATYDIRAPMAYEIEPESTPA